MQTLSEIRSNIAETTRENAINSLIDEYINLTLQEINDPAWAFEAIGIRGYSRNWTFNRRKTTFATVASTESYVLERDVDRISLVRQEITPIKLKYLPDDVFYRLVPKPSDSSGTPLYYRIWEEEGVSTRLSTDDLIKVVSSSTADTSGYKVSISGYNTSGIKQSEELSLNGTTTVNGTLTYDAGKPLRISKSAKTNGQITVKEYTASTTLVILGIEERSSRFKIMSLYPIPDAVITIFLEYFTRIRRLVNNSDVADLDEKWMWVVRLGAVAKVRDYQNKPDSANYQAQYAAGVRAMVKADMQEVDYIPYLTSHHAYNQSFIDMMLGDFTVS